MLTDLDIVYVNQNDNTPGIPLVWIIDGQCLYDIPVKQEYAEMFLNFDKILDISNLYTDHAGITVRFLKNEIVVNELKTSEYFGSILLSSPQVLNLSDYPYGRYVISPDATFDGEQFILTGTDMNSLVPWHVSQNKN